MAKSDLFVLENALRMSNVALVRDSARLSATSGGDATGSGFVDCGRRYRAGYGITVVPLRFVSAQLY